MDFVRTKRPIGGYVAGGVIVAVVAFGVLSLAGRRQVDVAPVLSPPPPPRAHRLVSMDEVVNRASELRPLNSLLILQSDSLLVEEYFWGMEPNRGVNVKSISKSLLSPLVGIAIHDGLIEGVDQPLSQLLPEYFQDAPPATDSIKLHHLLSMTTGLEGTSFGNYGEWIGSRDWVRNALDRPFVCETGTCMTYSTGNAHIAGVILSRVTGKSLLQYASEKLFEPLGVTLRPWDRDPQGYYLGGNNMRLSPRDLLLFGQLYLKRGVHEGEQLVPSDWIDASWQTYTISPWNGHGHGYFWWSRRFAGEPIHFAWGYGGQFVLVMPTLDAVAVITSDLNQRRPRNHTRRIYGLLRSYLVPALASRTSAP